MLHPQLKLMISTAAGWYLALSSYAAQHQTVDLERVPVSVVQTAEKAVPGVTFTSAFTTAEEGRTIYELRGKDARGRRVEVDVAQDRTLLEVETEITEEEVSQAALATLKARLKGFKAKQLEMSVRYGGKSVWYEFQGSDDQGKPLTAEVNSDGRKILIVEGGTEEGNKVAMPKTKDHPE